MVEVGQNSQQRFLSGICSGKMCRFQKKKFTTVCLGNLYQNGAYVMWHFVAKRSQIAPIESWCNHVWCLLEAISITKFILYIEINHVIIFSLPKGYILWTSEEEIGHFGPMAGWFIEAYFQGDLLIFFCIDKYNDENEWNLYCSS